MSACILVCYCPYWVNSRWMRIVLHARCAAYQYMTSQHEAGAQWSRSVAARAASARGFILISRTTTQFLNVGVSRQPKTKKSPEGRTITELFLYCVAALLDAVIATCKAASQKVWNCMKNTNALLLWYNLSWCANDARLDTPSLHISLKDKALRVKQLCVWALVWFNSPQINSACILITISR